MKKHIITLLTALAVFVGTSAAESYEYTILHEVDTTFKAKIGGISFGSREVHHVVYEYPSTDTDKQPIKSSGVISIPKEIIDGTVPCDGIIMFNHHTIGNPSEVPSQGGLDVISGMLANPLKPNYIVVACDYIGYGSSIDHPIAYLCGDTNARNSLDGLLAARQMLSDKDISQGRFLFNVGYSQGGSEAMYAAKLRDMEYSDKITFTKTFAGGGVMDCEKAYDEFIKLDKMDSLKDCIMMLISLNENYHLGIDYKDLFQEPIASCAPIVVKSKNKGDLMMEGIDSLHQVLQPAYLTPTTEQYQTLKAKLAEIKITNGWIPDTEQLYYYEHSRHDNYVPIQCGRSIIQWMKENGFTPSLVPGKTNLQTMALVFKLKHQQSAIVWVIQTIAAIQYWPALYYDGELNTHYHGVVHDLNLMKVVKFLESIGIDLRKMVASRRAAGETTIRRADIFSQITSVLDSLGLTLSDLLEMLNDSGISLTDVLEVVQYVMNSQANGYDGIDQLQQRIEAPVFLMKTYEKALVDWLLLGGAAYDTNYSSWGW